jgi:AGZA family xanthine/uracil permease-like MFS transporter
LGLVVFNGTVMRGEPAHGNLKGAQFLEEVRTAPSYRLYSIRDRYPAMIRREDFGATIEAELYEVPDEVWPGIRDSEPPGLYRGPVVLEDGRQVDGMLGEAGLISDPGVRDITTFGGWRAYLAGRRPKTGRGQVSRPRY